MLTTYKEEYLKDPCRVSSLPYWKSVGMRLPENLLVVHEEQMGELDLSGYTDEHYFRLKHGLRDVRPAVLPNGYVLCHASVGDFAAHIRECYASTDVCEAKLQCYTLRSVYAPELWIAVSDSETHKLVATGIGEMDADIGEGILEWIQVSENHRRRGLGEYLVLELLRRMTGRVNFVTVSGQVDNPTSPKSLYKKCGFTGSDVWHVLRKK